MIVRQIGEREFGKGWNGFLCAEPGPDDSLSLLGWIGAGGDFFNRDTFGVGRRFKYLALVRYLPSVIDAAESALLVFRQGHGRASVRTRLVHHAYLA